MTRRGAVHRRLYRWYLGLTPDGHRDRHGDDQAELFADLIAAGHRPWRLWMGALPDLISVLRTYRRRTLMSHIARIALYPLSALNAVAGLALAGVAASTDAIPVWVAAPAFAVAAQGLYTLIWLRRRVPLSPRAADILFATGEAAAFVTGLVGITAAFIAQGGGSDPEYGPPTMLALVVAHALVGLMSSAPAPSANTPAVP